MSSQSGGLRGEGRGRGLGRRIWEASHVGETESSSSNGTNNEGFSVNDSEKQREKPIIMNIKVASNPM